MTATAPRILTLRLKAKWWNMIASGAKTVELRARTPYWHKRLIDREYDEIHLWNGYPHASQIDKLLRRQWTRVAMETITHEEFGPDPVEVFAIDVSTPV